jgi:hypothetical protein
MADFKRGIKAGVAAAAVYLIISVIFEVTGISVQFGDITMAAGLRTSLELMDPSFVITLILVDIVPRVLQGIVFGAVFAALYNYLPGVTSIVKGVVFSAFLWIIAVIQAIYTTPGWAWHADGFSGSGTYYSGMISLSSVGLALAGIISALVFGALTGFLWGRFRGKELAEERKGKPVLLVSFILGGLMWMLSAIGFIIGVIIGGAPLIEEPGPFWWYGVLFVSVFFLGLPGWVLTLAAWRKTKRDESGLKFGVAGGVIMALTGQMLLPGLLAITGGVFSGRKLATESSTAETGQ